MVRAWLTRRLVHVEAGRSRVTVGHEDLAAWLAIEKGPFAAVKCRPLFDCARAVNWTSIPTSSATVSTSWNVIGPMPKSRSLNRLVPTPVSVSPVSCAFTSKAIGLVIPRTVKSPDNFKTSSTAAGIRVGNTFDPCRFKGGERIRIEARTAVVTDLADVFVAFGPIAGEGIQPYGEGVVAQRRGRLFGIELELPFNRLRAADDTHLARLNPQELQGAGEELLVRQVRRFRLPRHNHERPPARHRAGTRPPVAKPRSEPLPMAPGQGSRRIASIRQRPGQAATRLSFCDAGTEEPWRLNHPSDG